MLASDPTGHSCNNLGYYLQYNPNSYDSNVQRLQHQLNAVSRAGLTEDGYFGGCTEAAVRNYQSAAGIGVDGVVGDETWGHLFGSSAPAVSQSAGSTQGNSGGGYDVSQIQQLLNNYGYGLAVDGDYGPLTTAAVRDFQSHHNLEVDGIVGPQTWQKLFGNSSVSGTNTSNSSVNNPKTDDATTITSGMIDSEGLLGALGLGSKAGVLGLLVAIILGIPSSRASNQSIPITQDIPKISDGLYVLGVANSSRSPVMFLGYPMNEEQAYVKLTELKAANVYTGKIWGVYTPKAGDAYNLAERFSYAASPQMDTNVLKGQFSHYNVFTFSSTIHDELHFWFGIPH